MLSALDPHSGYMPPSDFEKMQVQSKGEFGGVGIEITQENGILKVVSPIDGTPADLAGNRGGRSDHPRGRKADLRADTE